MTFKQVTLSDYVARDDTIENLCRGKRVLHLGCVGFTDCPVEQKILLARQSLHQRLSDAADCLGIDLDRETVTQLQTRGVFQNVVIGDAERLDELPRDLKPFDLVVAGDIIEHLSNPGKMLEGIKPRLKPDGRLIVSTPNSLGLPAYLRHLTGRFHEGLQHVVSFNAINLTQLLERHGYRVAEFRSCYQDNAHRHGVLFHAGRTFFKWFPKFGGTLLLVARLESPTNFA
jgi:2-polyprenyl-3-methyl-5-hydroxy-6-metoxy-1,4-benzoquinol methylase